MSLASVVSPAAVTGAFGLALAAVAGFALVLIALTNRSRQGGTTVLTTPRSRLYLGVGLLGLAAVVGLIGYLKLSLEPDVNRQIPYLASAGMALVLLSAGGAAFIVGEQLRGDDRRIEELEAAVVALAGALTSSVEAPPRTGAPAVVESEVADAEERAEAEETTVVTGKPRKRR